MTSKLPVSRLNAGNTRSPDDQRIRSGENGEVGRPKLRCDEIKGDDGLEI